MSKTGEYRVIFWNARGVRNKYLELIDLIDTREIDIACINETFLDDNVNLPHASGYNIIRLDKSNHSGGLMFIIKNTIHFSIKDYHHTQLFEVGAVTINAPSPFNIYLVYCPGGSSDQTLISNHFLTELTELCSSNLPFFVMGDFNAKHRAWNCVRNNKSGKLLFDFINDNEIFLSYPDTPSYNPASNRKSPSTIDLMISDGRINTCSLHTIETLSSDHYPIELEINCPKGLPIKKSVYDYSRANWDGFATHISNLLFPIVGLYRDGHNCNISNHDIDDIVSRITEAILSAQHANVPMRDLHDNPTSFMPTPILRTLISARNYFRRRVTRTRVPIFKQLHNIFKKKVIEEIKQIQNLKYSKILLDCNQDHNKIYKVIKNKRHVNLPNLNSMAPGSRRLVSPVSKAEAIATNFEKNHRNTLERCYIAHSKLVNNSIRSFKLSPPQNPEDCPTIGVNEIATTIKNLKINKAGGLDGVLVRHIKRLPVVAIHLLAVLFSSCVKMAYFPNSWKIAKTIPIPKPGKDRKEIISYRPIALLSCLSKLFERIIHTRLNAEMEAMDCIPDFQFGFRRGHSTVHALRYLTDFIRHSYSLRQTTAALYFDVAKAFDQVWHEGLLYKMLQLGFSDWIVRLITSFLNDRRFEVHIGETVSRRCNTPYGVPQGSVLSPSLYNIFIHDIPTPEWGRIVLYADDTVILMQERFIKKLVKGLVKSARRIITYYKKWKISVNGDKTELMFHTKRRTRQLPPHSIQINGNKIKRSKSVRYLGYHIDERITGRTHVEKTILKTNNLSRMLYPLVGRHSVTTKSLKVKIYKTYMRPALLYAAPILDSVARTHKNKLQVQQNKWLRRALERGFTTRIRELHIGSGVPTVNEFLSKLAGSFTKRCEFSNNNNIRNMTK